MNPILTFVATLACEVPACPQGGIYLGAIEGLRGACAVTAAPVPVGGGTAGGSGSDATVPSVARFLVCVPEEAGSGSGAAQVAPIALVGDEAVRADGIVGVDAAGGAIGCAADVAASEDGTVAVADAAGVVRVLRAGAWSRVGEGVLAEPSGVAFHPRGLVVSDRRLRAVLLFDPTGSVVGRLGEGQLADPRGLAVLADGTVVVADRLKDCLWRFPAAAGSLPAREGVAIGEFGSSPGQFSAPGDVAVVRRDGGDCLAVADELNHRVQLLEADGKFVGFFGMHALIPRMGAGRIHYPRSIAVGADGTTLAVAEAFEDRVQFFALTTEPTPPDGSRSVEWISSHFGADASCAADLLAVIDVEAQAVAILDARTTPPIHMAVVGGGGATPFRFGEISGIGVEPVTARVWVGDRARARIDIYAVDWDRAKEPIVDQFIPRLARSIDLAQFGRRAALARTPDISDIEFDPRDPARVLLLDWENREVLATDGRFTHCDRIPLPPEARSPEELAVAPDGSIAVADPVARRVFVRSPEGEWSELAALGGHAFLRPSGVGYTPSGELVVSDAALDAVVVGTAASARVVGERGVLDEQFWDPQAVLSSPKGVIVIDRGNHRFQRFGDGFAWNLTGSLGRYYDRKRRGSPGGPPAAPALVPPPVPARSGGGGGGA